MNQFEESLRCDSSTYEKEFLKKLNTNDPYTICDLLEQTRGNILGKNCMKALEDKIFETDDILQIYEFMFMAVDMELEGFDRDRFEKKIRDSENAKLMCYSIGFVPGINVNKMLSSLYKTNNAMYIEALSDEEYAEVLDIRKIDPNYDERLQEAKQADYFPESLSEFVGFKDNIEELKEKVIESENPYLITEAANYLEYLKKYKGIEIPLNDLTDKQIQIGDPMNLYEYLASNPSVDNKMPFIKGVVKSGRKKFIKYVSEYVPGLTDEERLYLEKEFNKTKEERFD